MPPLMELETTGLGRARLNPNLYADVGSHPHHVFPFDPAWLCHAMVYGA